MKLDSEEEAEFEADAKGKCWILIRNARYIQYTVETIEICPTVEIYWLTAVSLVDDVTVPHENKASGKQRS